MKKQSKIQKKPISTPAPWSDPRSLLGSFAPFFPLTEEKLADSFKENSGISVSEDEKNVYVEACLPGISPQEITITYERGILFIKGEKKEETKDRQRTFYKKAHKSFFYQVAVPGDFNDNAIPEAVCKDGILQVIFAKNKSGSGKKTIPVKKG